MKKTFTINLGGIVFQIDEDAFEKLKSYIDSITKNFENTDERDEIIADIEARIAELFSEKLNDHKQIIDISDVDEVISIMGSPEDISDEENDKSDHTEHKSNFGKRMYRDPSNRVLGGVGSGMAAYFGTDRTFMRVLLLLTFFISGPIIYLVLWIVLPEAKTASQRLEMKGEPINISNIERSVKDEFHTVKNNFKKMKNKDGFKEAESILERIVLIFLSVFNVFFRVILIIVGIVFAFAGLSLLFVLLYGILSENSITFFDHSENLYIPVKTFVELFISDQNIELFWIGSLLVIGIPLLSIAIGGIRMVFGIKKGSKVIGIVGFVAWIAGIVFITLVGLGEVKYYKAKGLFTEINTLPDSSSNTLYVNINEVLMHDYPYDMYLDIDKISIVPSSSIDETDFYDIQGKPELTIEPSPTSETQIIMQKKARGLKKQSADSLAENIQYKWHHKDSILSLDPYFVLPDKEKFRIQEMNIILQLPLHKKIYLGNKTDVILYDIRNTNGYFDSDMTNKLWEMTPNGLSLIE